VIRVCIGVYLVVFSLALREGYADPPTRKGTREALRCFNDLIGSWRATGLPEGSREQKQRGFWSETIHWVWQFKGDDAWLEATFDTGKYFKKGELHYLPENDSYQLRINAAAGDSWTFQGQLKDRVLILNRTQGADREEQRLELVLLHSNRFLYRYAVKPAERTQFTRLYEVGATKQGVPFAGPADATPECIVTGGKGTIRVSYKGQTYHVCCTGCRDAFRENPDKYIKEAEERKAKQEKEGSP
jgi:YHS domain-containing protein